MKHDVLTSKGAILPFVVPAIIEVVLISTILITMLGAHRAEEIGNRYGLASDKVDAIFFDVSSNATKVLIEDDEGLDRALPAIKELLYKDAQQFKSLQEVQDLRNSSVTDFASTINDFSEAIETLAGARRDGAHPDSGIVMGKMADVLTNIQPPAQELHKLLATKQKESLAQRDTLWTSLILMLVVAMAIPVTAALYAFVFAGKLSNRMNALREGVVKLSLGDRVNDTLEGTDEFSELHGTIREISLLMERARQKERAMIDNAGEIICSLDETLRLSEANPAVQTRLGYNHEELIGTNIQSLIHAEDRDQTYGQLESVKTGSSAQSFEARLRHQDGHYVFTEWSTTWSPDEKSILCIIHDVSDRKEAEQLKQEVIAMVSHDLRAPLTSIGVTLDMVLAGAAGELNDRGNRMVKRAQISVTSLISMIKDLLDIERYEAGGLTLSLEQANVRTLIDNAVHMVKPESERKKLNLEVSCDDISFRCDHERVNRVLVNLINNAIKFSQDGKTIFITGKLLKHRSASAEIEFQIIDEGPGIPENKLQTIFDKFTQVGTGSEGERMGSGLGLAICKALVEAHRGKIGVKSTVGEGTTFWFRLPEGGPGDSFIQEQSQ